MKKLLSLFLVLMTLLSLFAGGSTESSNEKVSLTVWYYADDGVDRGYNLWAEKVKEAYPYITLDFEELPYDSGPEKYTLSIATNTNPDLYFDAFSRCAQAITAGRTLDLTELREQYADKFLGTQADGVVDGRYHAIVTNTGAAYCLYINMTKVMDAGLEDMLPEDKLTWSYDEYLDFLRALKKAYPDDYPMELYAGSQSSDMWYYSWFIGNGVKLTNDDLSATAFNTGDNKGKALQVLNLFRTVYNEGLCNPGVATTIDVDGQGLWEAGKAIICHGAFSNASDWYRDMQDGVAVEFEYDAYAMPTYEGKEIPMSGSFGSYSFIAFDSGDEAKNDAIKKAVEVYLSNPEMQTIITNATGRLSVMTDTIVEYDTEEIAVIMERGASYSASYTDSSFGVLKGWWTEFRGTFYPNLQDFYIGRISAQEMLDKWQSSGDAVITKYSK